MTTLHQAMLIITANIWFAAGFILAIIDGSISFLFALGIGSALILMLTLTTLKGNHDEDTSKQELKD